MIDDSQAQKCVQFLWNKSPEASAARATRVYMEEYRKSLKAIIMQEHGNLSAAAAEAKAYADPRYIAHLDGLRAAVEEDEKWRWQFSAVQAKLEAWRTMSANKRTEQKHIG